MHVIIGATGHTGSVVTNKLLANGKKVRVVGRNADHLASFTKKGAEPFVGNVTDKNAITKAFAGAQAVYVMLPPEPTINDYYAYAKQATEAFASAIEQNRVKYAVSLSSVGADRPDKTGPIVGLHNLEERLNQIAGINVLHIRAAYFMENTLGQADAITQMGSVAGPLRPELKFPLIASRDIGEFAGDAMSRLDFAGRQIHELQGQRDLSYAEITAIIGKAIGKPDLKYTKLTSEQFRGALQSMGMSENSARLLVEMADSMESEYIKPLEARSPRNTTPTSYETWVRESFLPVYQSKRQAA
ncbi:MAG TPA: NAD(P)H-binding protein [Terriglobales bacterium]|nr:NAD(P)H-binding protein [Terriglobales bacterium]